MFLLTLPRRTVLLKAGLLLAACLFIVASRLHAGRMLPAAGTLAPITRVDSLDERVALTFDLTWGDIELAEVLRALDAAGLKATFFVGHHWVANHPDLLQAMYASGHEIGTLGMKIIDLTHLSQDEVTQQLAAAQSLLQRTLGIGARLFRPPHSRWKPAVLAAAQSQGLYTVTASLDAEDAVWPPPAADLIVRRVVRRAQRGDVILLNASDFARHTGDALPAIIKGLQGRGFKVVPVSQMLPVE